MRQSPAAPRRADPSPRAKRTRASASRPPSCGSVRHPIRGRGARRRIGLTTGLSKSTLHHRESGPGAFSESASRKAPPRPTPSAGAGSRAPSGGRSGNTPAGPTSSSSERGGPLTDNGVRKIVARTGEAEELGFPAHRHSTGYKLANEGQDTRAIQHYLGHRNIQHTVRYMGAGGGPVSRISGGSDRHDRRSPRASSARRTPSPSAWRSRHR